MGGRNMFRIMASEYDKLITAAVKTRKNLLREEENTAEKDPEKKTGILDANRFAMVNDLPTIEELKAHKIGPEEDSYMDYNILAYLVFYAEEYCVNKRRDEYEFIFKPDPKFFSKKEIADFEETRKYIQRTIIKSVEIIDDDQEETD